MNSMPSATRKAKRNERGAVAIIVAISMLALCIGTAMVLDFGVVRLDRQQNKLASDAAVMAGLRAADGHSGQVLSWSGVCGALAFLKANRPALSGLPDGICATPDPAKVCDPASPTNYVGSVTSGPSSYQVWIRSPYIVNDAATDAATGGAFSEESLGSVSSNVGEPTQHGCDQIAVIIKESTTPGLGRLARSAPVVSRIRSVGRVKIRPGETAPALLLLDRTHCQVLQLAAGGPGADSHIVVHGASAYLAKRLDGTAGMVYTPGSIHADTNGTVCSGGNPNPPVFLGKSNDGIVAYAAPDASSPGSISSVAGLGSPLGTIRDSLANVYGSTVPSGVGTRLEATGRSIVTRKLVDDRYLGGVTAAVAGAQAAVFSPISGVTAANAISKGYKVVGCNPSAADLSGVTPTDRVYVDCTGNPGFKGSAPIVAQEVIFSGQISSSANVSLPNAKKVYVFGSGGDGIDAGGGFSMNTASHLVPNPLYPASSTVSNVCSTSNGLSKAVLFVASGGIKATGGLLQLCNTTAIMMGGQPNACLPTTSPVAPMANPCAGTPGTGQLTISGNATQDWTAPNNYNDMSLMTDAQKQAEWSDPTGLEDLALWDESGSNYKMAGGGLMHLVGVFMTPNAAPFEVKGSGGQTLNNAQFVATSFAVTGGATLDMTVDPNNAMTLPELNPFTLVR